ncbi:MAG: hypothetical protein WAM82_30290 [Thermoanaerobaculia bacterium]
MSNQTTSSGVWAPRVELGTLVTCAPVIDTQQPALTASRQAVALPYGIRNARPRFAAFRPGALQQAPLPHC